LIPAEQLTRPFFEVAAARTDRAVFSKWFEENQPDVIFTLYHEVERWVRDLGLRVPEDVGLIQYEWRSDHAAWAGMDQRNDLVGAAAVDMLISMVHHNERGVPEHPRATLIGSHWVDGKTVAGG
jgi:LacI family transcriptional regulator